MTSAHLTKKNILKSKNGTKFNISWNETNNERNEEDDIKV